MATAVNFTAKFIESRPAPKSPDGRAYYYDEKQRGLILMVTGRGIKSFQVRGRYQGRSMRVTVGAYPKKNIPEARREAMEILTQFARGENPSAEKHAIRKEETFGNFFNKQYLEHAKKHKRTRSWKEDEGLVRRHLSEWMHLKLSAITHMDVMAMHSRIGQDHSVTANRLLSCIQVIYNKAIEWGWRGENPARHVKRHREVSRERFLHPQDELPKFMAALDEEEKFNPVTADFFRVALQTGARRSNVLSMRWDEINETDKVWRIPADKSKNGTPLTVSLTDSVLTILAKRKLANKNRSPWVFPGAKAGSHLQDPKKALKRVLTTAGIENLHIHDLRRTLGSYMAAQGATTAIIGKTLGHKSQQSTKIYERLNLDSVREFVNKTESIFKPIKPKKKKTVRKNKKSRSSKTIEK